MENDLEKGFFEEKKKKSNIFLYAAIAIAVVTAIIVIVVIYTQNSQKKARIAELERIEMKLERANKEFSKLEEKKDSLNYFLESYRLGKDADRLNDIVCDIIRNGYLEDYDYDHELAVSRLTGNYEKINNVISLAYKDTLSEMQKVCEEQLSLTAELALY